MIDCSQFNLTLARQYALLAQRAYLPAPCAGFFGCIPGVLSSTGASYFLQDLGDYVAVVFRGSQSVEDFIQDAKFVETTVDGVGVHLGFWEDVMSAARQVTLDIVDSGKPFVCVGHSLGADEALLTGWQAARPGSGLHWLGTYAFAPARAGNKEFKQSYDARCGDKTWCVECEDDPVPWLPPVITGAKRVGQLAFVSKDSTITLNPSALAELRYNISGLDGSLALLPNHAIQNYIDKLNSAKQTNS